MKNFNLNSTENDQTIKDLSYKEVVIIGKIQFILNMLYILTHSHGSDVKTFGALLQTEFTYYYFHTFSYDHSPYILLRVTAAAMIEIS
jgi:hypothetical protein